MKVRLMVRLLRLYSLTRNLGLILQTEMLRQVVKTVRRSVLNGCTVVFNRVFPTKFQAENHYLWKMAEQLGAICLTEVDPSVTHVVSTDTGTEKSRWTLQEKFVSGPPRVDGSHQLFLAKAARR